MFIPTYPARRQHRSLIPARIGLLELLVTSTIRFLSIPSMYSVCKDKDLASSNMLGHVTLTDGKKIVTFSPPWRNPPVCITNDQSTIGASKAIPTTTTLTIVGGPS